jgi:hypothetical protein
VRLGIEAPRSIQVHRAEVYAEVQAANAAAVTGDLTSIADRLQRMNRPGARPTPRPVPRPAAADTTVTVDAPSATLDAPPATVDAPPATQTASATSADPADPAVPGPTSPRQ